MFVNTSDGGHRCEYAKIMIHGLSEQIDRQFTNQPSNRIENDDNNDDEVTFDEDI